MRKILPYAFAFHCSWFEHLPILCPSMPPLKRVAPDYSWHRARPLVGLSVQRASRRIAGAVGKRYKSQGQLWETIKGTISTADDVSEGQDLTAHPSKSGIIHVFDSLFGLVQAHTIRSSGTPFVGVSSISMINSTLGMVVGSGSAIIALYRFESPATARARSHAPSLYSMIYIFLMSKKADEHRICSTDLTIVDENMRLSVGEWVVCSPYLNLLLANRRFADVVAGTI